MFDSIKRNLSFVIVILIGLSAIVSFSIFYTKQKEFSEAQKEFFIALDALEIDTHELSFAILQNYIYAYNNNDLIAKELEDIEHDFERLIQTEILLNSDYSVLQEKVGYLKNDIDHTFSDVERYLMYNAAIKNSLLFLSSLQQQYITRLTPKLLQKSIHITQALFFAKRINDISYLSKDYLLTNDPKPFSISSLCFTDTKKSTIRLKKQPSLYAIPLRTTS